MKNLNAANFINRALLVACVLGFAGALETNAFAKLSKKSEFEAVESEDIDADEIGEEVVVVRKAAPKKARRVVVEEEAEVIPASTAVTVNANASSATEAKAAAVSEEETTGGRIGKMINSKLDDKRRKREEDMRRKQKEDEDKLVSRIGGALDKGDDSYEDQQAQGQAQAQSQQVIVQDKKAYKTTAADEEYVSDLSGTTTSKASSSAPAITISPNIGMGMLSAEGYEVSNGTAVGLSADFGVDENVVINVGYTYTEYEIGIANSSAYANGFNQFYSPYGYGNNAYLNNNTSKMEYNQNVIDAGMKYLLFDRSSRIRPYFGGGAAYMKGYLNYPQRTLNSFQQNPFNSYAANGQLEDYEITGWTAYLQLGAILNFSDNFGMGVNYKYHKLISSTESSRINNYGFVQNGYNLPVAATDKDFVSGSLAESDFHTLGLSLNLSF